MSNLQINGLLLGSGAPTIAVSLTETSRDGLVRQARAAKAADLLEWRADYFPSARPEDILPALAFLRQHAGKPVLFTFRSAAEGGEKPLDDDAYGQLYRAVIAQGAAGAVDIELSRGQALCRELAGQARQAGLCAVLSSHDFTATPPKEEMLRRLAEMRGLGADLPKIAVWPQSEADVLALLEACHISRQSGPLVAIAMGGLGRVSRVAAGLFGSALTFCAAGACSAPGQIDAAQMRQMLDMLYT